MRPISIKIKGINSYVTEQSVDFEKLSESNVFGIFGETGSGKTTILDSIILALYGVSDRDTLQNIINVNTKDAYIEFVFEMADTSGKTHRYYVRRDFKLRSSGLKADAILNDVRSKKTLAEQPDNVNNKILEIIGIGKKEFTKCIALPQGEFDRFLSDTPAVRKKTLAKLFDLEQFGIILNEKLKDKKNQVKLAKATLEEKVAVYQGIDPETIANTENILKESDQEIELLTNQIEKDKQLVETIKNELTVKSELLDAEVNLSIKQSELAEINLLQKQIEYTEKYGEYTILTNKYNSCLDETNKLNDLIDVSKNIIKEIAGETKRLQILLDDNHTKTKEIESKLKTLQVEEEKRKLHEEKLESLKDEKEQVYKTLSDTADKYNESIALIEKYKTKLIDLQAKHKELENVIFDNMDIIDKLSNCQQFKTKQDFALFLTVTRNKINPEDLYEVENFNIYDEVMTVIHDIENYELGVRKEVGNILKDLDEMNVDSNNIDSLKEEYQKKNEELNKRCDDLEDDIIAMKEKVASTTTLANDYNNQIESIKDNLDKIKNQIDIERFQGAEISGIEDIAFLIKTLNNFKEEENRILASIDEVSSKKQKALVDIEVSTTYIDNYKERLLQLKSDLKPYSKLSIGEGLDQTLIVDVEELPILKQKVADFRKEYDILESNTNALREKTKDYVYTKDDYNSLLESISANEEKLSDLKVFINVNKITMDIQKQNLAIVMELNKELDKVNHEYENVEKLEKLLLNGALIDFVAEEYMGLITDFANSFVYQISKGKYLLNYDGEFNVIDNFNGGIKRSVKTLSGGERFIVSLSLALGISQSIAVNNNKNFNFFFIDEGFGNLSENYIEKVLQSFSALINLNFTVGFITHVEKMQYYLNSRIVVTKDNNEDGSKIDEFY